jgi:hypothetical protein
MYRFYNLLLNEIYEIFDFRFFHESVSPKPLSIPITRFDFFLILGDSRSSGVVDMGEK